ncbi:MAG: protein kinase [Myxococcota bacterium]
MVRGSQPGLPSRDEAEGDEGVDARQAPSVVTASHDEGARSSATWRELRSGDVVRGRYALREEVGSGGMGTVWVAHDRVLDIDVAVKALHRDIALRSHAEAGRRFLREARATARLVHPHIVRIQDVGETDEGQPFLVMERLRGQDLATVIEDGTRALAAPEAVHIAIGILDGLHHAHDHGVVHRDVKPENVFLAEVGTAGETVAKLIDFGIARIEGTKPFRMTRDGTLLGSPMYMSPEQATGETADARSDLWAASVVLYEMLAGAAPFSGASPLAIVRAVVDDPPAPLSTFAVDDALGRIVMRGLEKDPELRWQSAAGFGDALRGWLEEQGFRAPHRASLISISSIPTLSEPPRSVSPLNASGATMPPVSPAVAPSRAPVAASPGTPLDAVLSADDVGTANAPRLRGWKAPALLAVSALIGAIALIWTWSPPGGDETPLNGDQEAAASPRQEQPAPAASARLDAAPPEPPAREEGSSASAAQEEPRSRSAIEAPTSTRARQTPSTSGARPPSYRDLKRSAPSAGGPVSDVQTPPAARAPEAPSSGPNDPPAAGHPESPPPLMRPVFE